jgi:hypothetical protein
MPFLSDFQALLLSQPRYNLKQVGAENSTYADVAVMSKNCYYCFGVFYCEDVYYSRYSRKCVRELQRSHLLRQVRVVHRMHRLRQLLPDRLLPGLRQLP